jgi:rod shape-determining protein MreC
MLVVFLALSVLVITLDFRSGSGGFLERGREWSISIVAPMQRGFATVLRPIGNLISSVGELGHLRADNRRLEARNEQLSSENGRADEIVRENQRLRDLLRLQRGWISMRTVAARIYSPDPGNYGYSVYIDKGRADGVRRNLPVIAPEGLVGRTTTVAAHDTVVLLLEDSNSGASARIQDVRDTGTVTGNGLGRSLSMELVGKNAAVSVGDEVATSGLDDIFPESIPVGRVARAEVEGGATSMAIDVDPNVDPQKLDFVLVLLTGRHSARAVGRSK